MRIASIVSAAALLAIATAGSALAAEPFATLDGVSAQPMSSAELASVQGEGVSGSITGPGGSNLSESVDTGDSDISGSGSVAIDVDGADSGVTLVGPDFV